MGGKRYGSNTGNSSKIKKCGRQSAGDECTGQKQKTGAYRKGAGTLSYVGEGQAKEAFHQAFIRDEQQMEAFYTLIARYVQTLLEIAARYEQAEARNAEIAGSRSY